MNQADLTAKPIQFGNYQIVRKIASGGMAEVYEAYRLGSDDFQVKVALKVIRTELTANERFLRMFINEAHLGSTLHHPNIVEIQDFNRVDETYYLAMEFVEGIDLSQFMQRVQARGEPLPKTVILDIAMQALGGLGYAHSARAPDGTPMNIVHRDLKPSNFLINRQGTVKIADFGIAKASTNMYQTQTQDHIKGTLKYMSPEQVDGADLTPTSDLFSLATILYELATYRELFDTPGIASTLIKIATANIDDDLNRLDAIWRPFAQVLRRMLHRSPEERFENSAEVTKSLRTLEKPYAVEGALERYLRRHPAVFAVPQSSPQHTLNIPKGELHLPNGFSPPPFGAVEPPPPPEDTDQLQASVVEQALSGNPEGEEVTDNRKEDAIDSSVFKTVRGSPILSPLVDIFPPPDAVISASDDIASPDDNIDAPSDDDEDFEESEIEEGVFVEVPPDSESGRFPAFLGTPAPEEALVPGSAAHRAHRFGENNAAQAPFEDAAESEEELDSDYEFEDERMEESSATGQDPFLFSPDVAITDRSNALKTAPSLDEAIEVPTVETLKEPPAAPFEEELPPQKQSRRGLFAVAAVFLFIFALGIAAFVSVSNQTIPTSLTVKTRPPGAQIFLDGVQYPEKSPAIIELPEAGKPIVLTIKAGGFENYQETLVFEQGQALKRNIGLSLSVVEPGKLAINSVPVGAKILLDGEDTGKQTPFTLLEIPAGIHSLSLNLDGFLPLSITDMEVLPGKTLEKNLTLEALPQPKIDTIRKNKPRQTKRRKAATRGSKKAPKVMGQIVVNTRPPDARVIIDGKYISGQTPLKHSLPVGRHTLRLELGDDQKTHSFEVKEKGLKKLVWDFTSATWLSQ